MAVPLQGTHHLSLIPTKFGEPCRKLNSASPAFVLLHSLGRGQVWPGPTPQPMSRPTTVHTPLCRAPVSWLATLPRHAFLLALGLQKCLDVDCPSPTLDSASPLARSPIWLVLPGGRISISSLKQCLPLRRFSRQKSGEQRNYAFRSTF